MPVRGKEVKITSEDLENRLGNAPAVNERPARSMENQRILTYISLSNDADELNRIGQAAARRLRDIGAARPRPQQQKPEKKKKLTDRALLHLYLNLSPFLLALAVMLPLAFWLGAIAPRLYYVFGSGASFLRQACPPSCTGYHLAMWAAIGGISLLVSFLASYALRKRLLKAI